MMRLYHFTSAYHLERILCDGYLDTTEANLSLFVYSDDPRVVWFTTEEEPTLGHGLEGSMVDKTEFRLEFEVDENAVVKWIDWAREREADEWWLNAIANTGGGWEAVETWYVAPRRVPLVVPQDDSPSDFRLLSIVRREVKEDGKA